MTDLSERTFNPHFAYPVFRDPTGAGSPSCLLVGSDSLGGGAVAASGTATFCGRFCGAVPRNLGLRLVQSLHHFAGLGPGPRFLTQGGTR